MQRKQLSFVPKFEGSIEGWSKNFIIKNLWRIGIDYEFEDLLQEAYIKFLHCKEKYPNVNSPKHFMSLFKRSFINRIHDLSKVRTIEAEVIDREIAEDFDFEMRLETIYGACENDGYLVMLFEKAPKELKLLLQMLTDEDKLKELRKPYEKIRTGNRKMKRITTNEKFCRVLGIDTINLTGMMKSYLLTINDTSNNSIYQR